MNTKNGFSTLFAVLAIAILVLVALLVFRNRTQQKTTAQIQTNQATPNIQETNETTIFPTEPQTNCSYFSEEYLFSLVCPNDWEVEVRDLEYSLHNVRLSGAGASTANGTVDIFVHAAEGKDLEQYLEFRESTVSPTVNMVFIEDTQLASQPALKFTRGTMASVHEVIYSKYNDYIYEVALERIYWNEEQDKLLDKNYIFILDSFKFE